LAVVIDGSGRHTPESFSGHKVARVVWIDVALLPAVGDALAGLTDESGWYAPDTHESVDDVTTRMLDMVDQWYSAHWIGMVAPFAISPPIGWLALIGQTVAIADYPELAAVVPDAWTDETAGTMTLPNLIDRMVMGTSTATEIGDEGGEAAHTLILDEIPSHDHQYTPPVLNIDLEAPGAPDLVAAGIGAPTQTGQAGGGQPHNNLPPYTKLIWGIWTGRDA
jgi:microcystin-dependent protein